MNATATTLRRKRVWTVGDFAEWLGVTNKVARTMLLRLNEEIGGMLLQTTRGANRKYSFFPSLLAKAKPEIFERVESLEGRVEEMEEAISTLQAHEKKIAMQTGSNTRDIERLKQTRRAA